LQQVNDTPDSSVSRNHTHLIIGLVLLQTICLFQREGGGLAPQNAQHHAMLVSVSRVFLTLHPKILELM
jgi:hypothetical protein